MEEKEVEWVQPKLKKAKGPKDNDPAVGDKHNLSMNQVEDDINKEKDLCLNMLSLPQFCILLTRTWGVHCTVVLNMYEYT